MRLDWNSEQKRIDELPYRLPKKLCGVLDVFKRAVHEKNTTAVMIADGRSGMGKTTLSNQCAKYLDPNYSLDKIHYDPEEFLYGTEGKIGLSQAVKGDFLLFDEAMLISSRSALSKINRMIVQAMSMIRSKNIFVGFCVNSIFDLDRNLTLHRADLLLHVYGASLTDRGQFCAFFKGADGKSKIKQLYLNGKKYYSYTYPTANFFTRFSSHFVVDEDGYEKQKQEGINKFLGSIDGKKIPSLRQLNIQENIIINLSNLEYSPQKIVEITGVAKTTVYNILRREKYKGQTMENDSNSRFPVSSISI